MRWRRGWTVGCPCLVPVAVGDVRSFLGRSLGVSEGIHPAVADPRSALPLGEAERVAVRDDGIERPGGDVVARDAVGTVVLTACYGRSVVGGLDHIVVAVLVVQGVAVHALRPLKIVAAIAGLLELGGERRDLGSLVGGVAVGTAEEEGEKEHGVLQSVGGLERGGERGTVKHGFPGTTHNVIFLVLCKAKLPLRCVGVGGVRMA